MGFEALAKRLPEWGRLFDAEGYAAFQEAVRAELLRRGEAFSLREASARVGGWELPLLPLAQRCARTARDAWPAEVSRELEERFAEQKLGHELDAIRGDFERARPALKLRIERSEIVSAASVSAPIAGGLRAVLVLDLPSFVTPVRQADLASWERPAEELVRQAIENVKAQEQLTLEPTDIGGEKVFAISGRSVFVATLGLAADDLLGGTGELGALIAMPSAHILLCHALRQGGSLRPLHAMAAAALQAFENAPSPLSPDLLWKRADRFVALPVRREQGETKCELPSEFDELVAQRLS